MLAIRHAERVRLLFGTRGSSAGRSGATLSAAPWMSRLAVFVERGGKFAWFLPSGTASIYCVLQFCLREKASLNGIYSELWTFPVCAQRCFDMPCFQVLFERESQFEGYLQ